MEYSEKMYEESKRPKMDYKRAGQEAREGGMSFMGGGKVGYMAARLTAVARFRYRAVNQARLTDNG
jgi:hypothetical protein